MSKLLITGASGHLGAAVTKSLLQKTAAANINLLVRDATKVAALGFEGVQIHTGNYDDYTSLLNAFKGIDKIYLISGNDLNHRSAQHERVISAAQETGVKHIVYTSFQRKNETESSPINFVAEGHLHTENLLKNSGLTYTLLQHGLYADLIPVWAGEHVLETKTIFLPAGEGKTAFALRTDLAEAGANVLLDNNGKYDDKNIGLAGTEALSWSEIAGIISSITGEKINYVSPSATDFEVALTEGGVPEEYRKLSLGFSQAILEGEFDQTPGDLQEILGRKPVSVSSYLTSVYGK